MTRWLLAVALAVPASMALADVTPPARERFRTDATTETPDFQKHVLPLMGKAGAMAGRATGRSRAGGFRLSLFGYDFKADHDALTKRRAAVDRQDTERAKSSASQRSRCRTRAASESNTTLGSID